MIGTKDLRIGANVGLVMVRKMMRSRQWTAGEEARNRPKEKNSEMNYRVGEQVSKIPDKQRQRRRLAQGPTRRIHLLVYGKVGDKNSME